MNDFTWVSYDNREYTLSQLEPTHLANIIRHVTKLKSHYPSHVLPALLAEAGRRGLGHHFIAQAPYEFIDTEGTTQSGDYIGSWP